MRWMIRTTTLAAVIALGASGGIARGQDQDRTRTRDPSTHPSTQTGDSATQDRDRIREVLRTDGRLSTQELTSIDPEIDRYLSSKGDPERLQQTVRAAAGEGCTGACAGDVVREMNRVMARGYSDQDAASVVQAAARKQGGAAQGTGSAAQGTGSAAQGTGTGDRDRDRLRAQVDEQLQLRDRDRDRDRDARDAERARAREQQQPSPGGGGQGRGR